MGSERTFWLIVQRIENYERDQKNGFQSVGFSQAHKRAAKNIKEGDILIFYVASRVSCFAGARQVISNKFLSFDFRSGYDDIFPIGRETKALVSLPRARWIHAKLLYEGLTFSRNATRWQTAFRNSVKRIPEEDGLTILSKLYQASEDSDS